MLYHPFSIGRIGGGTAIDFAAPKMDKYKYVRRHRSAKCVNFLGEKVRSDDGFSMGMDEGGPGYWQRILSPFRGGWIAAIARVSHRVRVQCGLYRFEHGGIESGPRAIEAVHRAWAETGAPPIRPRGNLADP